MQMPNTKRPHGGTPIDVAIIGAGPYGLSIAAYLTAHRRPFRIFGSPMEAWRHNMPRGMCLKSEGFASDIYDPESAFTLARYCKEQGLPYEDVGYPIPIETFISYGQEFQRRLVPNLEDVQITHLASDGDGFTLTTSAGETLTAKKVVLATGIAQFGYVPPELSKLTPGLVTHSSQHSDPGIFRGQRVAVIGAGSSAVDLAALLHEAGADVQLVARRHAIAFHSKTQEPRPLLERIRKPRSGLGLGWKSKLCDDAPLLFHAMPEKFRLKVVQRHLGPAPGWFIRDRVEGLFPIHLGVMLREPSVSDGKVKLTLDPGSGDRGGISILVDHVIAATGYRVDVKKLQFLDEPLTKRIRQIQGAPVLRNNFESSVAGLFAVGTAAANSFGPLARFACGAKFTARRITPFLVS